MAADVVDVERVGVAFFFPGQDAFVVAVVVRVAAAGFEVAVVLYARYVVPVAVKYVDAFADGFDVQRDHYLNHHHRRHHPHPHRFQFYYYRHHHG